MTISILFMMIMSTMIIWLLKIMSVVSMNETDGMSHVMIVNATDFDGNQEINIQISI